MQFGNPLTPRIRNRLISYECNYKTVILLLSIQCPVYYHLESKVFQVKGVTQCAGINCLEFNY